MPAGFVELALIVGNRHEDDRHADQAWQYPEKCVQLASGDRRKQPRATEHQESRVTRTARADQTRDAAAVKRAGRLNEEIRQSLYCTFNTTFGQCPDDMFLSWTLIWPEGFVSRHICTGRTT